MKYIHAHSLKGIFLMILLGWSPFLMAQLPVADSLFESISGIDPSHARTGDRVLLTNIGSRYRAQYKNALPVQSGQTISVEVYAFFEKHSNKHWVEPIVETFIVPASQPQLTNQLRANDGNPSTGKRLPRIGLGIFIGRGLIKNLLNKSPKATIECSFYDKDSNFVYSIKQKINKDARDQWQLVEIKHQAEKDGFVEVLIKNESRTNVWFDDLVITISKTTQTNSVVNPTPNSPDPAPDPVTTNVYHFYIRSFAPPGSFTDPGFEYEDDNRGFSLSDFVTSRIKMDYDVVPDGVNPSVAYTPPSSSPTIRKSDGASMTAIPSGYAQFVSSSRGVSVNNCRVESRYEGSNPFFNGLAPNIVVGTTVDISENFYKTRLIVSVILIQERGVVFFCLTY